MTAPAATAVPQMRDALAVGTEVEVEAEAEQTERLATLSSRNRLVCAFSQRRNRRSRSSLD